MLKKSFTGIIFRFRFNCMNYYFLPGKYDLSFMKISVPCLRSSLRFSLYTKAAGTNSNGIVAAALTPSETGNAAKRLAPVAP